MGGYKILDFKGASLTNGQQTVIPGIYEAFESNYGKQPQIHNLVLDSVLYWDFSPLVTVNNAQFQFNVGEHIVNVASGDKVTVL